LMDKITQLFAKKAFLGHFQHDNRPN